MTTTTEIEKIPMKELHFDRENPRLAEFGITSKSSDDVIIAVLWDVFDVQELIQSIAASGFFPHEPLIVAKEGGKNVVIEGNRRLAAIKILCDSNLAKKIGCDVQPISRNAKSDLQNLPIMRLERQESWRHLGFKHVNGPAKWSSYAKARYIAEVHRDHKIPLEEIANQIGDLHKTVQRLYRGLMILEQAEREKVYNREDRSLTRFAFSHLYTGMDYVGISSFLSLSGKNDESISPVPKSKLSQLGELCVWLYGNKKEGKSPVVQSQNPHLKQLDVVLQNREAVAALRAGADLATALEISRPPKAVFEEALLTAKRELMRARGLLTTGYDDSEDLLMVAGTVASLANDIHDEMERKRNSAKKKRSAK